MKTASVRLAQSIQDATTLDSLGWRLTLPAFRLLKAFAAVLLLCAAGVGAAIAVDALSGALPTTGRQVALIGAMAVGVYVVVLHAVRETLTVRRIQLIDHPFASFFAAMDLPRRVVLLAECRDRLVMTGALVCGLCGGVGARFIVAGAQAGEIVTLLALPAAVLGNLLAITAVTAAWFRPQARPRVILAAVAGLGSGLVVAVTVRLAASTVVNGSRAIAPASWTPSAFAVVLCAVVSTSVATVALRAVKRSDFTAVRVDDSRASVPSVTESQGWIRWVRVTASDLTTFARATVLSRLLFFTWAGGAAATGVQVLTIAPTGWQSPEGAIDRSAGVLAFLLGLTVAELLSRWIGPAPLAARWRASWEAGASPWGLAVAPVAVALVVGTVLVAPLAIAATAFGGSISVPLGIAWSAVACAWIATAIVPGEPPRADGSSPSSLAAAVFCVVSSAALTAAVLAASAAGIAWLGAAVSVLFLGGAAWVTRRRVLALPSRPLI